MSEPSEKDGLASEFYRERYIRRTLAVLQAKRKRMRDEIQQLVNHLNLLVPVAKNMTSQSDRADLLEEAAKRLGDEAFAQLIIQAIDEIDPL
jgi:predicted oxidoreductase (fatty acid repression mutant protein)